MDVRLCRLLPRLLLFVVVLAGGSNVWVNRFINGSSDKFVLGLDGSITDEFSMRIPELVARVESRTLFANAAE